MLLLEVLKVQFHFHLLEQNLEPWIISLISAGLLKEEDSTQGVKIWTAAWKIRGAQIAMQGWRLETDPGVGSFLPCHCFGNGWGNFYLVYRNCPVSLRENLSVTSCSSGSSWRAQGTGRSREGFKDHTCPLISLKPFHPFSLWPSQLHLCGHSSHFCLSAVHSIIPPLACKALPEKRWAVGLGPLVYWPSWKIFSGGKKPQNLQIPIPCFLKKW